MRGFFITFEGGEGSGKSTQARLLYEYFKNNGHHVILTREPGGTEIAEKLRDIVVRGNKQLNIYTEMLIFMTARSDHWFNCIKPALDAGSIVICDRFHDSTIVYQCICGGCDTYLVNGIYEKITNGTHPDCTVIIDIDPVTGLKRSFAKKNNTDLRFENKALEFHKSVRNGYLSISKSSDRYLVIDGTKSEVEVQMSIIQELRFKYLNNFN